MQKISPWLLLLLLTGLSACSAAQREKNTDDAAVEAAAGTDEAEVDPGAGAKDAGDPPSEEGGDKSADPKPPASSGGMIAKGITPRNGGPLAWCEAIGKRTTAENCVGYSEEVANLSKGVAAFDPPRQMVAGEPVTVRLGIARDGSSTPPRAQEMIGGGAATELRDVVIGTKMRAQLSGGRAFEIDPAGPQDKFMGRAREQLWIWNVTPKLAGKHGLSATITVLAEDGTILDNFESRVIEVDVAVSAEAAREAKRDRTREDLAWYQELGKTLTELWWVWIGLAIAIAVGIWRFIAAAKTGTDPGSGGSGDAGEGEPPVVPEPVETGPTEPAPTDPEPTDAAPTEPEGQRQ